jgi:hypothetical protein
MVGRSSREASDHEQLFDPMRRGVFPSGSPWRKRSLRFFFRPNRLEDFIGCADKFESSGMNERKAAEMPENG